MLTTGFIFFFFKETWHALLLQLGGGGGKNFRKVFAGERGCRNFYFGGERGGGGSRNLEVKIKIA